MGGTDEKVNHPQHYGGADNPYEAIKVIEAWSSSFPEGTEFHIGNTLKYLSRAGKKGSTLEDLRKARWYLDRAVQVLEPNNRQGEDDLLSRAVATFGARAQVLKLVEELAELNLALIHWTAGKTTNQEVITELADVSILIKQMGHVFGAQEIEDERQRKLIKLNKLVEQSGTRGTDE